MSELEDTDEDDFVPEEDEDDEFDLDNPDEDDELVEGIPA